MNRAVTAVLMIALTGLMGCNKKPPSAAMLAKLKGGTTTVVVYGFCVPMSHLIKTAITRYGITFKVNGRTVGTMKSCSYRRFKVPSGYWKFTFVKQGDLFEGAYPPVIFRPGKTQYLHMVPAGHGTWHPVWVDRARAEKGMAAIRQIGQMF